MGISPSCLLACQAKVCCLDTTTFALGQNKCISTHCWSCRTRRFSKKQVVQLQEMNAAHDKEGILGMDPDLSNTKMQMVTGVVTYWRVKRMRMKSIR